MKRLSLLFVMLIAAFTISAQYYYIPYINAGTNPGGLNTDGEYPAGSGLDASWTQILGAPQSTPAWSPAQTIPFTFMFNGSAVTSYQASSSGVVTFAASPGTAPAHANATLPDASIPDKSICMWGLQSAGTNDNIMSKTFGTAPNRQHWIFYTSYSEDQAASGMWTYWSIVLEETTNNIYIVDQRTGNTTVSLTLGIQIDATSAIQVSGSPSVGNNAGTDPTAADNSYYTFVQGTQPQYDVAVTDLSIDPFLGLTSAPFQITGTLTNYGSATITAFDLNYFTNATSTPVTATISGVSIAPFDTYNFTHPTTWSPSSSGSYDITVYSDNPNANTDEDLTNDTLRTNVTVMDTLIEKKVLVEEATGAWCGYCVDGAVVLQDILTTVPNAIGVAIHNGDDMAFTDGNTVNTAYAQGYPSGYVDRKLFSAEQTVGLNRGKWKSYAQDRLSMSIPILVEASHTYDPQTREIDATVTAEFFADMTGEYRVNLYIVEDNVTGSGSGYNQVNYYNGDQNHPMYGMGNPIVGYNHRHVLREMLGGPWGSNGVIPSTITSGDVFTKNYTFTLPAAYKPHDVYLIAVVQKYSSNANDREILNAEEYELDAPVGIETPSLQHFSFYPNPVSSSAVVEFSLDKAAQVSFEVYDVIGNKVQSIDFGNRASGLFAEYLDASELTSGIYFVRIVAGTESYTQRFIKN